MFENPRRGRQARNFITNAVPKILHLKSSCKQIFSKNCGRVPLGVSGRLKDFCLTRSPLHFVFFSFFFSNGPGRTVMCSLYIYTSQYLKENFTVRCIIFSLRTDIGKQTITFFATNNNNPIFHYKYKR